MIIYLVIPAYNEEETIGKVLKGVLNYLKNIIVVNDCSSDHTGKILNNFPIIIINNKKNIGYAKTLEVGVKKAFISGADYVITFDADGQHRADNLKEFIRVIESESPELVLGKRSFKNRFMEEVLGFYSYLKYGFSDPLCGMKAYKKSLFNRYGYLERKYSIATELTFRAIKNKASFIEVPIKVERRQTQSRFANNIYGNYLEIITLFNVFFM